MAELDPSTERALRARILELEALVEARTQAIVGLGAELAELRGEGSPVAPQRVPDTGRVRRAVSLLRGSRG
jgi:hypothetical protein